MLTLPPKALTNRSHLPVTAAILSLLFASGCASQPESVPPSEVAVHEHELTVSGFVSENTVNQIRSLASAHQFERVRVNIDSGDPLATMQLGYFIHRRNLDLVVDEYCLGPCANYLFTAAAHKHLEPNAIVAWSDGALAESWTQQNQNLLIPGVRFIAEQYLDTFLRREARFFERIGVDQQVTVMGYQASSGCNNPDYRGFYYAIPDLLRFGIADIHLTEGTWRTAFSHYPEQFCQVDLSEEYKSLSL